MQSLLLQKIDELPDPENVWKARAQRILYALEFAIRQLEDRVGALERGQ